MQVFKRIGKKGVIAIPKKVRAEVGLFPGNAVEITTNDDGSITIKSAAPCCHLCGSPEGIISIDGIRICRSCAKKIIEKARFENE